MRNSLIRDNRSHTSLHLASKYGNTRSLEELRAVLEGHPEATKATLQAEDQDGNLPLHELCWTLRMGPESIWDVAFLCPEALHHRNLNRNSPAELTLQILPWNGENPAWSELRLQMVQRSPPSVFSIERDIVGKGTNPVHRMCEIDSNNLELLKLLANHYPVALGLVARRVEAADAGSSLPCEALRAPLFLRPTPEVLDWVGSATQRLLRVLVELAFYDTFDRDAASAVRTSLMVILRDIRPSSTATASSPCSGIALARSLRMRDCPLDVCRSLFHSESIQLNLFEWRGVLGGLYHLHVWEEEQEED